MGPTLGIVTKTPRNFERIEFLDVNGITCSLQQSSRVVTEQYPKAALWLGRDEPHQRMHLCESQVRALINHLTSWLKTGSFNNTPETHMTQLPEFTVVEEGYSFTLADGYYWLFLQNSPVPIIGYHRNQPFSEKMPILAMEGCIDIVSNFSPGDVLYGPIPLPYPITKLPMSSINTFFASAKADFTGHVLVDVTRVDFVMLTRTDTVYMKDAQEACKYAEYLNKQKVSAKCRPVTTIYQGHGRYRELTEGKIFKLVDYEEAVRKHAVDKLTPEERTVLGIEK